MPRCRVIGAAIGVILLALVTLTACLGDPPPDPETAPLEVVLAGCVLNRDEVAGGPHEVALVGDGSLVVTDEDGDQVLSLLGSSGELVTTTQTYTFTCTIGDEESSSTLRSVAPSDE